MVHVPPGRVAAALEPLRSLDLEIVLAVDDRVDPAWVEGYRRLADRVLLAPFPGAFEHVYAWLREQCSGRWLLHMAADEVPSAALAQEVAQTIAADSVTHAWVPRRWLYPDPGTYLAQWPWRPDYQLRLLRNDPALVRFPATLHEPVHVTGPCRFLRAPIYHADLQLEDVEARERKCARYEAADPGRVLAGRPFNEAYFLPERQGDLRLASVPAEDAAAIGAFNDQRPPTGPPSASVERFDLDDLTRFSEQRSLSDGDYRARVALLDDDLRLVSGEARTFDVEVTNLGTTHWPGGMEAHPQIRLGYGWVGPGGDRTDGGRTAIGSVLRPGESAIVPLAVVGPDAPGSYEIEIDLVHELVRWFGSSVRARIEVRSPAAPAG